MASLSDSVMQKLGGRLQHARNALSYNRSSGPVFILDIAVTQAWGMRVNMMVSSLKKMFLAFSTFD